ncbi:MAG: hypothetical protein GY736_19995 [Sphingomonas sp.]|uniref:hypothetical protein n=1 Tax=Sphingomonas sp. TaxID=28214 RepID=UPI00258B05DA|nr:hypothetical protein [Sphingomonas sp.]MCP4028572.1 hypothetical protein [Sphingomonas sp.]
MTVQRTASGVPITARRALDLARVIADLVAVRPANWEDSTDPQQRAAWRAAEIALAQQEGR